MRCAVARRVWFDVSPDVVDAGADMTLHATVSCSPACDLRGHTLSIKDQAGADVGSVELTEFDGATNKTGEFVVKAPVDAGEHTWVAVCPAVVKEGVSYAETSTPISFTVKPHTAHVVAWDVPSAIVAGERFTMKVGIKCSNDCDLTNSDFGIYDHEGAQRRHGDAARRPLARHDRPLCCGSRTRSPGRGRPVHVERQGPRDAGGGPNLMSGSRTLKAPSVLE